MGDAGLGLDAAQDDGLGLGLCGLHLLDQLGQAHGEAGLGVRHNVELGKLDLGHGGAQALGVLLRRECGHCAMIKLDSSGS